MADLGRQFDANGHEPIEDWELVPDGEYMAVAVESDWHDNSAKTGRYLQFVWQILDEPYSHRKQISNLNLVHPNEKAVDFANRELATICRAVGKPHVRDSAELHNITCILKIGHRKAKDSDAVFNCIKDYKPACDAAPAQPQHQAPPPQQPAPNQTTQPAQGRPSVPVWGR